MIPTYGPYISKAFTHKKGFKKTKILKIVTEWNSRSKI